MSYVYKILLCFLIMFLSFANANAEVMADNGTSATGTLIFPKRIAMFCGISSHDAKTSEKIEECLNKLLRLKVDAQGSGENYTIALHEALHQVNNNYADLAVQEKIRAGDVVNQIKEQVDKPAGADGVDTLPNNTIRQKQEQSARLSALAANDIISLMSVYSSIINLNTLEYFSAYEFSDMSAEIPEEETEE